MRYGALSAYGEAELERLIHQRRVFNRLDWWTPYEWLHSDAFMIGSTLDQVDAGLLAVPVSFTQINALNSAQSPMAWLRWCAVSEGVSASHALRGLFQHSEAQWCVAGIHDVYCIIEPVHWLIAYLRDAGYGRDDDVITMLCRDSSEAASPARTLTHVRVRPARGQDLDAIGEVDHSAFDEQWHYPRFVLQRALTTSAYFSVAEQDGQIVGYQFANCYDVDAHITRLAVRADRQGRGIGALLLQDVLATLRSDFGVRLITLNTQASNSVSQRLYSRFGFEALQPSLRVMRKRLLG
jgi:ribosomal-protein-alanine N-acetyltransferase